MSSEPALFGLRVVELGGGIAAPLVGLMLAEHGAEVVRFADPSSTEPTLDAMLARDKLEASASDAGALAELVAAADVVIVGPDVTPPLDFAALRAERNAGLVVCAMSAFPADDPHHDAPPHEALAAMAGLVFNKPLGRPVFHEFAVAPVIAALYGGIGVLAALIARERTGLGQDVRTSLVEAALSSQVLQILAKGGLPRSFLPLRMVGSPFMRVWECGDGAYVYLHVTLPKHNQAMLSGLERQGYGGEVAEIRRLMSEQTRRDPSQVGSIGEAEALKAIYARIFRSKSARDWEEFLGHDLCCIKVRSVAEWLTDSRDAGMHDACVVDDPGLGELESVGPLVTLAEEPAAPTPRRSVAVAELLRLWREAAAERRPVVRGEATAAPPLSGVRVVDLSRIIAGPCAARVLAELGADVVSIQNETKLDWALSFHLVFNAGKRSVTLDFADEGGKARLWALLDELAPDVLIQNYRDLDLARAIGIGPEALRARFPAITYAHLNAYGSEGSFCDRPGFEQVVQAVSGIQLTYGRGRRPKLLPSPVIDIGCGLLGAYGVLLGLYQRRASGRGAVVTTHLTSVAVLLQLRQIAALQRGRATKTAIGGGAHRETGREVVAGIVSSLGRPVCIAGPRQDLEAWLTALDARPQADVVGALGRALSWRPLSEWRRSLELAGLAARVGFVPHSDISKVCERMREQHATPMVRRRNYPGAPRPLVFVGSPLHLSRTPLADVAPPPRRGEHTVALLRRIGVALPDGSGVVAYPAEKPFLPWLLSFVRWGYFAWRSGNI